MSINEQTDAGAGHALSRKRNVLLRIAIGTWKAISADNISLLAAGVAFYSLLAIFPGLAFLVAMFGLLADPGEVQRQLLYVRDVLPEDAWNAINTQLITLTSQTSRSLSIASVISLTLALINARLAVYAMMSALNIVYKREETRSFFTTNAIAMLFTIAALVMLTMSIFAVIAVPQVLSKLGFPELATHIIRDVRWPMLALLMATGLAVTYRFAPDRSHASWGWLTLGSVIATILWIAGSSGFSWYVVAFDSFDRLYGSVGAVVVLLYWLWVTAFAALMGAELDMQIQTAVEK